MTLWARGRGIRQSLRRTDLHVRGTIQYAPLGYKFTGKERDSESGLDNFGARYNSPNLGRFIPAALALSLYPWCLPFPFPAWSPPSFGLAIGGVVRKNPVALASLWNQIPPLDSHCEPWSECRKRKRSFR